MRHLRLLFPLLLCGLACLAPCQDAVPVEILSRTMVIRGPSEQGTAFTMDYKGKLYVISARHVLQGVADVHPTVQVRRRDGEWVTVNGEKMLYPKSSDVDIAIIKTDESVTTPFVVTASSESGVTMGQQVWFLGFPFLEGLSSHFAHGEVAPFIKRGTMSAIDASKPDAVLLYFDGFNNEGFSGGPIICWDFDKHAYVIIGVVRGYRQEAAKTQINGINVDTNILVNSGILFGYNIKHAIQAIEDDLNQSTR